MSFSEQLLAELSSLRDEVKIAEAAIEKKEQAQEKLDNQIKKMFADIKDNPVMLRNIPQEMINDLRANLSEMNQYGIDNDCFSAMEGEIRDLEEFIDLWYRENNIQKGKEQAQHTAGDDDNRSNDSTGGISMFDNYNARKEEVLRIYDEYCKFADPFLKNETSKTTFRKLCETLEKRAENIRNGKFYLIVAGEAKSGKSTFINAYLGEEILPMDVLQCTSALIEINYGETKSLTATYADGNKEHRTGEKDVQGFLKEKAAIQDKYRAIPVTAINNEILIKSKGDINPKEVEDLINKEKPDNQNMEEYSQLVWDYINENKDSWRKIITKITLSYPFSDEAIKDVTLIDSPGINALGMVGKITENFIANADALILTKSLIGGALESKSFMQFLSSTARERCKGAILLVLTQKAGIKADDLNKLYNQAVTEYGAYKIHKEHIAAVDSKLELYCGICKKKTGDEIEDFLEREGFDSAQNRWFKSKSIKSDFLHKLEEDSGFFDVKRMLEQFGRKTKNQQLYGFLDLINKGYDDLTKTLEGQYADIERAAGDPEKLMCDIAQKQAEIECIQKKMSKGLQEIRFKYTEGDTARIKQTANVKFEEYKQSIQKATSVEELKKKALEGQEAFNTFRRAMQDQIISDCDTKLGKLADGTMVLPASLTPVFTEEDLKRIEEETRQSANQENPVYNEFLCFSWQSGTKSEYSKNKHLKDYQEYLVRRLETIKANMFSALFADCTKLTNAYGSELAANAAQKEKEENDLCEQLKTAAEMRRKMESIKAYLQTIKDNTVHLCKIKGGLENAAN